MLFSLFQKPGMSVVVSIGSRVRKLSHDDKDAKLIAASSKLYIFVLIIFLFILLSFKVKILIACRRRWFSKADSFFRTTMYCLSLLLYSPSIRGRAADAGCRTRTGFLRLHKVVPVRNVSSSSILWGGCTRW